MKRLRWVAAIFVAGAVLLLSLQLATNNDEYSRYNTGWNGTSDFFTRLEERHAGEVTTPADLAGRSGALLLVIAPDTVFTEDEAGSYARFIASGNTLLLADDFGTGNSLLSWMDSDIRLISGNLSSVDRAFGDPGSVIAYPAANHTLLAGVDTIVLDRPAALEGGEPLARTSLLSWVNRTAREGPQFGRYPVLSRQQVGAGELIVLSDASVFINGMVQDGENRRLIENILAHEGGLLIETEHSRTGSAGPVISTLHLVRGIILYQVLIVGGFCLVLAFLFRRPPNGQ